MLKQEISLYDSVISVEGNILWNDNRRKINLKKPIRDIFEPLETQRKKITYAMDVCLSKKKLYSRIEQLIQNNTIPILLYFKEEVDESV